MSDYKNQWKTAKTKFENSTGVKKPAPTKKNLFGKAVRQKVGIGEAFGKVDKLMPDDTNDAIVSLSRKNLDKLGPLVSSAGNEVKAYIQMLTRAIDQEKTEHGKGADSIYRDLKILKTELEFIISDMKGKLDKVYQVRRTIAEGLEGQGIHTITSLRTLKTSIERNGKRALAEVQNILKNPTAATFNAAFPKAARELTQNIAQIRKFTLPDELSEYMQTKRLKDIADNKLANAVEELERSVGHFKREVIPLMNEAGTSPLNSTLGKFCNSPLRFPEDASEEDVKAGCKRFAQQVKTAMDLGKKII